MSSEPVPQSELDDAHHAIVAGFALALEQPGQLLGNWLTVEYYGLPMDYWDRYADRIAAVDAAAVQAAAKKFVDLEHMQWVAVGDGNRFRKCSRSMVLSASLMLRAGLKNSLHSLANQTCALV